MQNRCAVLTCPSGKTDFQPMFRFPHDQERSRRWVEKCQGENLIGKSPEQLYRYYRICKRHFETSAFDCDADGAVLKKDAVPTIFDASVPPQSSQLKHSKDVPKDNEMEKMGKKKVKTMHAETGVEDVQMDLEKDAIKTHLEHLFEVISLFGQQGIPPTASTGKTDDDFKSNNFSSFLKHHLNCGDLVFKEQYNVSKTFYSSKALHQLIDVCEKYLRSRVIEEVKQNGYFSLITDDPVKISGELSLPVFLRYVDHSARQQEKFVGFLNFEGDKDTMVEKMLSEITDKWGLNLEKCISQAHSCSGTHFHQLKMFSAKLMERHPRAIVTFRSTCGLNMSLAKSMALPGVGLVMSTFEKIESFFCQSPLLQVEFEHALSMFYSNKDKVNELKEICRGSWTRGDNAFEVALEIIEALLLCVDSVHDNEDMRWNDQATHIALEISKAITDFEFIMTLIVLKNVLGVTQAFGKNLQGMDAYLAADKLKGVVQTLKEMLDNVDVYNDFWTNEAVTLATAMEIQVRVPRSFLRKHQPESRVIQMQKYFMEHLSIPIVNHIISEMTGLFCEDHIKILRCLSLVPMVIEQCKSLQPEEENFQMFSNDIPNASTLSAELHCWWVKWSKKNKESSPSSLHETLQVPDVKFFPNMLAILRFVSILPSLVMEDGCDVAFKRFRAYMENTPDKFKSKSLAFLNISFDAGFDLDSVVDLYMKTYCDKQDYS